MKRKVHYALYPPVHTQCGVITTQEDTRDIEKVTCKRCLWMLRGRIKKN